MSLVSGHTLGWFGRLEYAVSNCVSNFNLKKNRIHSGVTVRTKGMILQAIYSNVQAGVSAGLRISSVGGGRIGVCKTTAPMLLVIVLPLPLATVTEGQPSGAFCRGDVVSVSREFAGTDPAGAGAGPRKSDVAGASAGAGVGAGVGEQRESPFNSSSMILCPAHRSIVSRASSHEIHAEGR